jgi:hypothetical protein
MLTNYWQVDGRYLVCTAFGSGGYEISLDYPPQGGWVPHVAAKRWATPAVLAELEQLELAANGVFASQHLGDLASLLTSVSTDDDLTSDRVLS